MHVSPSPLASPTISPQSSLNALREVQAQARYLFHEDEFAQRTGREPGGPASRQALQRLARSGRVVLAHKPAYWLIVPPEHEHYGAPPFDWWLDDLLRELEPDYYLALLSAARYWGSAHYALQVVQVAASRPRRPLMVGKVHVKFVVKQALADTPVSTESTMVAQLRVSTREATVLDLIRHQSTVGGIESVARVTCDLLPRMTSAGVLDAVRAQGQVPAAQRLGFILEQLGGQQLAGTVRRWLRQQRRSVQPLVTPRDSDATQRYRGNLDWSIEYTERQFELLQELRQ